MDSALNRLTQIMPPPAHPRSAVVSWSRLEEAGINYPESFRRFIETYGASVWIDHFSPFYTCAATDDEVTRFISSVEGKLAPLRGNMYDAESNKIDPPLYPEPAGLFPFAIDYSGSLYCWDRDRDSPDDWPIVCWFMGGTLILNDMSISQMLLEWFERRPRMIDAWGDINDLPPERIELR